MSAAIERIVRIATRQQWLSIGVRHRLLELACPPRPVAFETSAFGCRFSGRLDSYIDREVFFLGSYEPEVLDLLSRIARHRDRPVLLDIGANVGQHSLYAARYYAEIHAFEPYPPLADVLREQVSRNVLAHVHVHAVGLADRDEDAMFAAPADRRAGYGGFDNQDPNLHRQILPVRRGDSYLRAIGVTRVDVIKIDVEGSERRVVEGLGGVLAENRPALVVEYWAKKWPGRIESCLPAGYRVWALEERGTVAGIFNRSVRALKSVANVEDGTTLVALPHDWPIPRGYRAA